MIGTRTVIYLIILTSVIMWSWTVNRNIEIECKLNCHNPIYRDKCLVVDSGWEEIEFKSWL